MSLQVDGNDQEASRCASSRGEFQAFLDTEFPIGAMCALISRRSGRLEAMTQQVTGRLLCRSIEPAEDGQTWYELVIDPRDGTGVAPEPLILWVKAPERHGRAGDLWESEVRTDDADDWVLRLNADPPQQWRPTSKMRAAVTAAYPEHSETGSVATRLALYLATLLAIVALFLAACNDDGRPAVSDWQSVWADASTQLPTLSQIGNPPDREVCSHALGILRSIRSDLLPTPEPALDVAVTEWMTVAEDAMFECPPSSHKISGLQDAYAELEQLEAEVEAVLNIDLQP